MKKLHALTLTMGLLTSAVVVPTASFAKSDDLPYLNEIKKMQPDVSTQELITVKEIIVLILSIILIAALIYFFFFKNSNVNSISEEDIEKKDFLKDKQAVIYLSSTADQDMDGRGISYAIFIDKNEKAHGYKMNGLDSEE